MYPFVVLGFVSSIPSQEIGLGNISEMTYSMSSGTLNLNSVNQSRFVVAWHFSQYLMVGADDRKVQEHQQIHVMKYIWLL